MAQWAVIIPADQWATERLYHNESLTLPGAATHDRHDGARSPIDAAAPGEWSAGARDRHDGARSPRGGLAPDDEVLLVADDHVVALARAVKTGGDDLVLTYVRRAFDDPAPAAGLLPVDAAAGQPVEVEAPVFRRFAAALAGEPGPGTPTWLVSLALPIEAANPADAVRQFWTHVAELGPKELPAYVWPSGDELAMQAFVLGEEANQDPEEDEDD